MPSKLDFYLFLMYISSPNLSINLKVYAMRNLIISIVFSLVSFSIIAQGCLPEGVAFIPRRKLIISRLIIQVAQRLRGMFILVNG